MDFLSSVILCQVLLIAKVANSYVLLSADVEDFRTLAKKVVPESFADYLTKAISYLSQIDSSRKYGDEIYEKNHDENISDNIKPFLKAKNNPQMRGTRINFEELVAKVKKRIQMELMKRNSHNNNAIFKKKLMIDVEPDSTNVETNSQMSHTLMTVKRKPIRIKKKTTRTTPENEIEEQYSEMRPKEIHDEEIQLQSDARITSSYSNIAHLSAAKNKFKKNKRLNIATNKNIIPQIHEQVGNPIKMNKMVKNIKTHQTVEPLVSNIPFEKTYMKSSDSYEDYVTPERENVFASPENGNHIKNKETRFKITNNASKNTKKIKNRNENISSLNRHNIMPQIVKQRLTVEDVYQDVTEKTIASAEIEARTENLWFNGPNMNRELPTRNRNQNEPPKIATHFPTRQYFSVFTPEYVTDYTIYAKKYNFNEPLPEKDRMREHIKFFGDPESKVNKKIRQL